MPSADNPPRTLFEKMLDRLADAAPPSSPPTDLQTMLDELERHVAENARLVISTKYILQQANIDARLAARQSVVQLFTRLTEERDRLRERADK